MGEEEPGDVDGESDVLDFITTRGGTRGAEDEVEQDRATEGVTGRKVRPILDQNLHHLSVPHIRRPHHTRPSLPVPPLYLLPSPSPLFFLIFFSLW